MPCSDGGPSYHDDPNTIRRLDLATRLLCSLCRRITKSGHDSLIYGDGELAQWWGKHQEADRKRVAAEEAEREREEVIEAALAKLSPKERRLLKLRGLDR